MPEKKSWGNILFKAFTYGSLIAAFIIGQLNFKSDLKGLLNTRLEEGDSLSEVKSGEPAVYKLHKPDRTLYAVISEESGYGGPFRLATLINLNGLIEDVWIIESRETPAYLGKMKKANYPNEFINKLIESNFIPGDDVDIVSGATISSEAFCRNIRYSAHQAAIHGFDKEVSWDEEPFEVGLNVYLIVALFILAFVAHKWQNKKFKIAVMTISMIVLGFYLNGQISIANYVSMFEGFTPSAKANLAWWILIPGSLLFPIIISRNLYCSYICPFKGAQFYLNKISGMQFQMSPKMTKLAVKGATLLLWLSLMTGFITTNPGLSSFEPFAMFFALEGIGVQWYILPASVIGAFFIKNFFCRFFCPVGEFITWVLKRRNEVSKRFKMKTVNVYNEKE
jgi:hypothetical protein